jgi:hypothetical protein
MDEIISSTRVKTWSILCESPVTAVQVIFRAKIFPPKNDGLQRPTFQLRTQYNMELL